MTTPGALRLPGLRWLTGIGTTEDRMLVQLDIEHLMASAEMGLVAEALSA